MNEESPPEPAPPEVPPRGPSLHSATLRRRTEYSLPPNDANSTNHDSQYLGQGELNIQLRLSQGQLINVHLRFLKNCQDLTGDETDLIPGFALLIIPSSSSSILSVVVTYLFSDYEL